MAIEIIRAPRTPVGSGAVIWQVRLVLLPGHAVPSGWDPRRLEYRFDTEAAAVAFARLKVEASDSSAEAGQLAISAEQWVP